MDVVYRRTVFELKKAQARAHILEGLRIALENIDEVIEIIKKSSDGADAKQALMARFELDDIQSQAILDMRLQKLTGLETQAILDEYRDIIIKIAELEDILASETRRYGIVKQELEEVKEKYGDKRRTVISGSESDIDVEDLIQKEDVLITITRDGWAKRLPVDTYRSQGRGGRGIIGLSTKKEDIVKHLFVTNTHDKILFFSSRGMVYCLKAYQIPQASRTAKGIPIVNLLQLGQADRVNAVIPIGDFDDERFVFFVTKEGVVKKTALREFDTNRKGGIKAITLRQGDDLSYALITDGKSDIVLGTRKGLSIRFNEEDDVRPMGRGAAGVRGITLNRGDEVRGAGVAEDEKALLCVCEKGYGKRTLLKYYKKQKRGGKGILTIKASERNGDVVGIEVVDVKEDLLLISEKGIIIRQPINTISATIGRSTQGVRLMRLDEGDKIVAFEVFEESEDESFGPINGDS
jgi:DNA gyrase subunit A